MVDTYIFACVRPDDNVLVQERFATGETRPLVVASYLTTVNTANVGSILNCTFTSPVTRQPMLNYPGGYYVLLAWGQYANGEIQQHLGRGLGRCHTSGERVLTTAIGADAAPFLYLSISTLVSMLAILFLV